KAMAMEEAKRYFDEAMRLLDTLPETARNQHRRITLLVNQGVVMLLLLRLPEYYDLLTRYEVMAVRVGQPDLLASFQAAMGWCEWSFGDFDRAIHTLTQAVARCEAVENFERAGQVYVHLQWSRLQKGDYAQVLSLKEDVLRMMEHKFNVRWCVYALSAASI